VTGAPSPGDALSRLPHAGVARLVEQVVETGHDHIVCEGTIPAGNPFVVDGRVPSLVLLELAAQASALLELEGLAGARVGYLVRVRRAEFHQEFVAAGRPYRVRVERAAAAPPLFRYDATAFDGEVPLFAGSFSTFVESP